MRLTCWTHTAYSDGVRGVREKRATEKDTVSGKQGLSTREGGGRRAECRALGMDRDRKGSPARQAWNEEAKN